AHIRREGPLAVLQGICDPVLRGQSRGREGLAGHARSVLAVEHASGAQECLRLHQGVLGNGFHGRSREDRCAYAPHAWRGRSDRADPRLRKEEREDPQRREDDLLPGRAPWVDGHPSGSGERGSTRVSTQLAGVSDTASRSERPCALEATMTYQPESIMDTSTHSITLAGVVPPVCDAEAGYEHAISHTTSSTDPSSDGARFDEPIVALSAPAHGFSIARLRALVTELCSAVKSALDDERGTAEDSLRRATAILEEIGESSAPTREGARGGL